jgi:radical SAM superfamily enzyme YgiQ (UPF0313 family)
MKLTIVQPAMGHRPGEPFMRTWQMEPLAPAMLARLTPPEVEARFFDDRMERVPLHQPTDLVAITVEAYTARRAYEIAASFRRRGVPVVMGGVHATSVPEEVSRFADSVVVGEAETVWRQVLEDAGRARLQPLYHGSPATAGNWASPDRSIFAGKRYMPIALVETGRGCPHRCEFCVVAACHHSTRRWRPPEAVVDEVRSLARKTVFFVDDAITCGRDQALRLFRSIAPLRVRWVSQAGIECARDPELLTAMRESGCIGLLIGLESLSQTALARMGKERNGGLDRYEKDLVALRRAGIQLYATFLFGYEEDVEETFDEALSFALRHRFYLAAFNHLVPFPGTPLYSRLAAENRLTSDAWWLDPAFRFGEAPFHPVGFTAERLRERCLELRKRYYRVDRILRRTLTPRGGVLLQSMLLPLSLQMRREVRQRDGFPLGGPSPEEVHAEPPSCSTP